MTRLFPIVVSCLCLWTISDWRSPTAVMAQLPPGQRTAAGAAPNRAALPVGNPGPAANTNVMPGQPEWFPLAPEHDKYLNDILKYWEFQATQVQRFRCKFLRWEYDPVTLPRNPDIAATVGQGSVQYEAPDKGLYRVERVWDVVMEQQGNVSAPVIKEGKPQWVERKEAFDDHWVCDGKSLFQFDARQKQIIQRKLPPELQGKQIADGPLPFLFGAKQDLMKERYWIRVLPPPKKGRFYLEAIPKRRQEAAEYKAIHVVIDEEEFLPEALLLFDRAGGHTTFEFKDREKNWNLLPEMLNPWHRQFFAPTAGNGWKIVEEPFGGGGPELPPTANNVPAQPAAPRQAINGPALRK